MVKLEMHHIGIVTRSLEVEIQHYENLDYKLEGNIFEDPLQKIRGVFMVNNGTRIELLEGLSETAPTVSFLKKGIQMYHQGFMVSNIDTAIQKFTDDGAILVSSPVPAVAFENRRIAFLYLKNRLLIELIEKEEKR